MIPGSFHVDQTESHCVSTRTWLYLGAVIVGLSLMALEDPSAVEAEAPASVPTSEESTRLADAAAAKAAVSHRHGEGLPLRAKASEAAPLPTLRK